ALLGALHALRVGIPGGRGPDAAGRPRHPRDHAADRPVRPGPLRSHPAALPGGGHGPRLPDRRRGAGRVVPAGGGPPAPRSVGRSRHAPVSFLEHVPRAAVRRRGDRPPPARSAVGGEPAAVFVCSIAFCSLVAVLAGVGLVSWNRLGPLRRGNVVTPWPGTAAATRASSPATWLAAAARAAPVCVSGAACGWR